MAMVISSRAKGMIGAFIVLLCLSAVLVTASTKGWWFGLNKNNGEHVAARIQVGGTFSFLFSVVVVVDVDVGNTTTIMER